MEPQVPVVVRAVYIFSGCVSSLPRALRLSFVHRAGSSRGASTTHRVAVALTFGPLTHVPAAQAAMNSINLGFDIGVNTDVGPALLASDLINHSEERLELFM
jgi:hypothetical protein